MEQMELIIANNDDISYGSDIVKKHVSYHKLLNEVLEYSIWAKADYFIPNSWRKKERTSEKSSEFQVIVMQ